MNAEKCNAMILAKEKLPENFILNIGDISLPPENQVTLLGITLDSKLNFEAHIQTLCKEVPKKVNSLLRIASYLNVAESTDEFRFFLFSVNYCLLVWMFASKTSNHSIDKLHKRCFKLCTMITPQHMMTCLRSTIQ